MRSGSETEHDHGQPLEPVVVAATHTGDGCFEGSVPALYHSVCFGIVGWLGLVLDCEDIALSLLIGGHEVCSSVGDVLVRHSKKAHLAGLESLPRFG